MSIPVKQVESCTWALIDDTFICQHDEGVYFETVEVDTFNGEHDTYSVQIAICVDPDCDEEVKDYDE